MSAILLLRDILFGSHYWCFLSPPVFCLCGWIWILQAYSSWLADFLHRLHLSLSCSFLCWLITLQAAPDVRIGGGLWYLSGIVMSVQITDLICCKKGRCGICFEKFYKNQTSTNSSFWVMSWQLQGLKTYNNCIKSNPSRRNHFSTLSVGAWNFNHLKWRANSVSCKISFCWWTSPRFNSLFIVKLGHHQASD